MESHRRTALTAGFLFIAATAANLAATAVEQPLLSQTDYLGQLSRNLARVSGAGLLELVAAGTSAGIAIALYPVLKRRSSALAIGAVAFRSIEAVMYTLGAVGMLALLSVSSSYVGGSGLGRAWYQAIGDALIAVRQEAILAGVFAFVVGALMYYAVFYRARLVPRWLSGWGIVGILLLLAACLAALFSGNPVTSYTILVLPIAVQEMALAVWLIARGFDAESLAAVSSARRQAA